MATRTTKKNQQQQQEQQQQEQQQEQEQQQQQQQEQQQQQQEQQQEQSAKLSYATPGGAAEWMSMYKEIDEEASSTSRKFGFRPEDREFRRGLFSFHLYLRQYKSNHQVEAALLDAFTTTPYDFPYLSITSVGQYSRESMVYEEASRGEKPYTRRWRWGSLGDAASVFSQICAGGEGDQQDGPNKERRDMYQKIVNATWFRMGVWTRWLEGMGAGSGSGRCTRNTLAFEMNRIVERYHVRPDGSADPRWYTVGYLSSVLLHIVLKNSAENALGGRDILIRLTELTELHNLLGKDVTIHPFDDQSHVDTVARGLKWERDRLEKGGVLPMPDGVAVATNPPEWMDRWLRGQEPHPRAWFKVDEKLLAMNEPSLFSKLMGKGYMHNNAWFAPQLSHGMLNLDFVAPGKHRKQVDPEAKDSPSYAPIAMRFLNKVREAASGDRPIPFVVRLPAMLLGQCLAAGNQLVWGFSSMGGQKTWIRAPEMRNASFRPYDALPISSVGSIVIAGTTPPGPGMPPPIGLALPDEPPPTTQTAEEHAFAGPALDEIDDRYDTSRVYGTGELVQNWYRSIVDLWLSDLRIDTPEALLNLLSRVGSRYPRAIAASSAWTLRGFQRRLADEMVPDEMSRPRTIENVKWGAEIAEASKPEHTMYQDGKNLILSRLWMSEPPQAWLTNGSLSPAHYSENQRLWVVDAGPGTIQTRVLLLKRCHGGPALPEVSPMLTMDHLEYSVPMYRNPRTGEEDLGRVGTHRLRRILATPRQTFVLDGVTFTPDFLTNFEDLMPSHALPYGDLRAEVQRKLQRKMQAGGSPAGRDISLKRLLMALNPPEYKWDHLPKNDRVNEKTRRVFGVPDVVSTRVDIDTARYVVEALGKTAIKAARVMERRGRLSSHTVFATLQWTNILFDSGVTLRAFLEHLDRVRTFYARRVTLTLHPSLLKQAPGDRVHWDRVEIKPFVSLAMRQMTLRLDMTALPGRFLAALASDRFLNAVDQLPTKDDRIYLDFEDNRIQGIPSEFVNFSTRSHALHRLVWMMLAGNPIPDDHPVDPGVMTARNRCQEIKAARRDRVVQEMQDALARGEDPRAVLRREATHLRTSLSSILPGYSKGYDSDATVGWNISEVQDRPGPDLNPYGRNWMTVEEAMASVAARTPAY